MVYLWQSPDNTKNKDIGDYLRDLSPEHYLLQDGQRLAEKAFETKPIVEFEITKAKVLNNDVLANNANVPLVNQKVKLLLQNLAPDEVQFFPAICRCVDGELECYEYLNATKTFTGLDHDKSVYSLIKGTDAILGFSYCTYKKSCMGDLQIARDAEYKGNLLVSEKVKILFDKQKISGVWFVKPEEFYKPIGQML